MKLEDISEAIFENIEHADYPDYSDAYIVRAKYKGIDMTEEQLEELNDSKDLVYHLLMEQIF